MRINVFYSQSLNQRMAMVHSQGEFLSRIKQYDFYVNLYAVEGHYVEVYYNITNSRVEEIELLDPKDERLNLYAVFVNLSDFYGNRK